MPIRKMQVSCPNCRTPVMVDVEQVIDLNEDPEAKQRLLSGQTNLLQCPTCNYQGQHETPMVYHDHEKEFLLTFVPPSLGLPADMQERVLGPMITGIVNHLPQEKRKAYLLQPKMMLTFKTLIETILEGDGVTKEMMKAQQDRLALLQRLATIRDEDTLKEVAGQEVELMDEEFFTLLSRLAENSMASGDQNSAQALVALQQFLLPLSPVGQEMQAANDAIQAAAEELNEVGQQLTREKLLDLVIKSPDDFRARAYVSLVRAGMDYQFFQLLSDRIDKARGDGRKRLAVLRENLLEWTQEHDQQSAARLGQAEKFLEAVIASDNLQGILTQNSQLIDDYFISALEKAAEAAEKSGDQARMDKLNGIVAFIQQLSAPPKEMELINELVQLSSKKERMDLLNEKQDEITDEFMEMMTAVRQQVAEQGDPELSERVELVHSDVVRFSMMQKMRGG